jgi:hypothetical protein
MKQSYLQAAAVILSLSIAALAQPSTDARGGGGHGGGGHGGSHAVSGGARAVAVGPGFAAGRQGALSGNSRPVAGFRFGRGRGRRGYYSGDNYGQSPEEAQAEAFAKRQSENPYANVPQHVNVSNYVKNYAF